MHCLFLLSFVLVILTMNAEFITYKFGRLFSGKMRSTELVSTYEAVSLQQCATISAKDSSHTGFNFAKSIRSCHVFQEHPNSSQCFSNESNYDYFSRLNPCQPNPCKYNVKCQVVLVSNNCGIDFKCNCPAPTSGKTCTGITCDTKCVRDGSVVYYFYFAAAPLTWIGTLNFCKSKEMDMIMIKNKTAWTTVSVKLMSEQNRNKATPFHYWLGLNRSSLSSAWIWVDNSPLSFANWDKTQPDTELCGMLPSHLNYSWADEPCDETYSIACQKYYSNLAN